MDQEIRTNTVDAKNRLNELLTEIEKTKCALIVERRGQPVAVVVDYETYEKTKSGRASSKQPLAKELSSFHQRLKKKYPKGTGDSAQILRDAREGRRSA